MSFNDDFEKNPKEPDAMKFFTKMVDELVEISDTDLELKEGIQWLDEQAKKKGISFYQMVFDCLYKADINKRAKEWLQSRS